MISITQQLLNSLFVFSETSPPYSKTYIHYFNTSYNNISHICYIDKVHGLSHNVAWYICYAPV